MIAIITIQSIVAQALEEDKHALMASLDLSAAFDTVNIDLLLKRMRILGLPKDVVDLVSIWLKNRYVQIIAKYVQIIAQICSDFCTEFWV